MNQNNGTISKEETVGYKIEPTGSYELFKFFKEYHYEKLYGVKNGKRSRKNKKTKSKTSFKKS